MVTRDLETGMVLDEANIGRLRALLAELAPGPRRPDPARTPSTQGVFGKARLNSAAFVPLAQRESPPRRGRRSPYPKPPAALMTKPSTLLCITATLLVSPSGLTQDIAYVRDSEPWGIQDTPNALTNAFGAGSFDTFTFTDAASFSATLGAYRTIVLQGSDDNGNAFLGFMDANRASVESWVFGGGRLFMYFGANGVAAGEYDLGFGLRAIYPGFSSYGLVVNGTLTNGAPTIVSGNYFSHAVFTTSGPSAGFSTLIEGYNQFNEGVLGDFTGNIVVGGVYGEGVVLAGGITLPFFWSAQEGDGTPPNLLENLYLFVATAGPGDFVATNTPVDPAAEGYAALSDYAIATSRRFEQVARSTAHSVLLDERHSFFVGYSRLDAGTDSSRNSADYDLRSTGTVFGLRSGLSSRWEAGLYAGFDSGDVKSSSLRGKVDGKSAGLFSSYSLNKPAGSAVFGSIGFSEFTTDLERNGGLGVATADRVDSQAFLASVGAATELHRTSERVIKAEARLAYALAEVDAFAESGPSDALHVRAQDNDSLVGELAAILDTRLVGRLRGNLRVGLEHDFFSAKRTVSASVGDSAPAALVAQGLGRSAATLGTGLVFDVSDKLALNTTYQTRLSRDAEISHAFFVGGGVAF